MTMTAKERDVLNAFKRLFAQLDDLAATQDRLDKLEAERERALFWLHLGNAGKAELALKGKLS